MSQIYTDKVDMDRTPTAPDTTEMKYFDTKRKQSLGRMNEMLNQTLIIQEKRKKQEIKSLKDLTKKKALQVYKNAYTLYPNKPKKYQDEVSKGLEEVYSAVPDSEEKNNVMAEVSISGSGYDSRVQKGYWDYQDNVRNTRMVDQVMGGITDAQSNLGLGMMTEGDIKKYTTEELAQRQQSYQDSRMTLQQNYMRSKAVDSNGNPIFNASQRAIAKDAYENQGAYAAVDYVQDNVATNYNSAVSLRNRMVNDPDGFMDETKMSDEARVESVKQIDKILKGQITADQAKEIRQRTVIADATYKELDITIDKDGKLDMANKHNNLNDIVLERTRLEADIDAGVYQENKKTQIQRQAALDLALVTRIEDNVGVKGERWEFAKKLNWGRANVGETALKQANENLDVVVESLGLDEEADKEQILNIKAQMYDSTLKDLQRSKGFTLTSKDTSQKDNARKVANNAYFEYVKGVAGDKIYISEENKNNPIAVKTALRQAMMDVANENSQASIDEAYQYRAL